MKLILLILGIYILYRFIMGFVLPVAIATRQMNRKMKEFRQQQEEMYHTQTNHTTAAEKTSFTPSREDYLEFEEVK